MVFKWRATHISRQAPCPSSRVARKENPTLILSFPDDTTEAGPGEEGGPSGPKLDGVLLKELEADYPKATADVMALASEEVSALFPPEAADGSESAVPNPEKRRKCAGCREVSGGAKCH